MKLRKLCYIIIFVLLFYFSISTILKDNKVLQSLIYNNDIINGKSNNYLMKNIFNLIIKKDGSNPLTLLDYNYKKYNSLNYQNTSTSFKDSLVKDTLPLVYIYNTHDKEGYINPDKDIYNIDCNVKTASYILQEQLKLYGINSIVEEKSPTSIVSKNKEDYTKTYAYSREYALTALKNYPSIKYVIDLHRDGVKKEVSTVTINDKSYAKLMFFLGMGHENSSSNKKLVNELESYISNKYPTLLRTTFIRKNDSYNQDISPNAFLIEVGGNYNTITEVYNSLEIFAEALANQIKVEND